MNKINLKTIVGGMLQEKFANSFKRVMENMQDVNTPYKDKREIIIKMSFVQNESRDDVLSEIKVSEKLAAQNKLSTHFSVGKDLESGEIFAEEYGNQLKGQTEMDFRLVDSETGEILDESNEDTVINFRDVK